MQVIIKRAAPENVFDMNSCGPSALSIAFEKPYDIAYNACHRAGRIPLRGMTLEQMIFAAGYVLEGKGKAVYLYDEKPMTFLKFAQRNSKGNFLVLKNNHAVALKDGVYYDIQEKTCSPRSRVQAYVKETPDVEDSKPCIMTLHKTGE